MSRNLFYIAQVFTPEPYLKDVDFIKSLQKKGWNPTVITGFPNYPHGVIYEGYKNKLFSEEVIDGIRVIRVYTYPDHSLSAFRRSLYYFVFAFFAALAIIKYGKKGSVYLIGQSAPFVIFCAWAVKLFKRKSLTILDIQDVFPDNIRVSGFIRSKAILDFLDFVLDNIYYKSFDYFLTVSESFRRIVSGKKINLDRILTLYNWSMVEKSQNEEANHFKFATKGINIVYAGNIGIHQGLSRLVPAMNMITAQNQNVFFHFFGDGTDFDLLKKEVRENKNILLHGRVHSNEITKYLDASDFLFLHLINEPIYEHIIPSKLQAYIEIGKPILGGIMGEARDFITRYELGEVFESENQNQFIQATQRLCGYSEEKIANIRHRSKSLYETNFSRSAGVEKLHQFMLKIIE